ncbi:MAG: tetratricopeptide repeat protein [candidate division KSB1 bacterium]|nr:tetratricopeptide repeat protein [candidate division KSB1 bacterium]MDZ7285567.1 tetratricopeptide repeat protein [candidate division KSB1 bacterium]MDZ7298599.1 tetratricopeptide repeat protein [candidate division KSB1 bacterium]MDZ7306778.1 tetratricopeptide repeat protein [candidate division KSB1 bacterium]MDZ7349463.1 tetratricopeptide repeat protein [candidate division KSB1 bacterium]
MPGLSPRPGAEFLNAQKAVEYYQYEIRRKPEIVTHYVHLAEIFLQEARITGRHHEYVPHAQRLLAEALRRDPDHFLALGTKAALLLTLHQFAEAKALAEQALVRAPKTAFLYGVLCDALVELGDYAGAVKVCDEMLSLKPDLRAYARAAHLRELHGDLAGACQVMKMACDAGVFGQENRAWVLYQLGKLYFIQGKLDTAAYLYNGILQERPNYAYAFAGLAQVQAARGQHAQAVNLLKQAYRATPDHGFLEQLATLYREQGDAASAGEMIEQVLENFRQHEAQGWNVDLEFARFCLEHDVHRQEALQRARREYERRPAHIEVLATYAWALHGIGQTAEALPLMEQALRLRTPRPEFHVRAAVMAEHLGQHDKAIRHFEAALALPAGLPLKDRQFARQQLAELQRASKLS